MPIARNVTRDIVRAVSGVISGPVLNVELIPTNDFQVADWTVDGVVWTIGSNTLTAGGTDNNAYGQHNLALVDEATYQVEFNISTRAAGTIILIAGATVGNSYTTTGAKSESIVYSSNAVVGIAFWSNDAFIAAAINTISLKRTA